MLPSHRLLARAFHRVPLTSSAPITSSMHRLPSTSTRSISTDSTGKWEGRKPQDHTARETDSHNVQQDAVREGKAERAEGNEGNSRGTSEKAGDSNKKAKEEFPEAPDMIGMQDERGGKSEWEGKK